MLAMSAFCTLSTKLLSSCGHLVLLELQNQWLIWKQNQKTLAQCYESGAVLSIQGLKGIYYTKCIHIANVFKQGVSSLKMN